MGLNKKTLITIAVQLVNALMLAVLAASSQGFSLEGELYLNCRYLCDGFFIVAVLFVGMGTLLWVSTTGFFDIFSYAMKSLLVLFSPLKKPSEHPHFYEYKCEREAKRKGKSITHTVLIVGLILLALSLICLALYYNLMPEGVTM